MEDHPDVLFVRKTAKKLSDAELDRWMDSLSNQVQHLEVIKEMYRIMEEEKRRREK